MSNKNSDYYFLKGAGEMGELIRAKDWSKTSLGDPATWPQSLRTMVAVMLDNPFGMYIAWGTEYTQLYNDGYRPILGATKHPQALGISTRETFSEIWNIIESMFDGVMQGKAVGFPDLMLPLNRNGFVEECYFDFAYSPIRKDNGEVGGVLVTVIETTEKKRATEALRESNERYINNIGQAPVAMCILRGNNYVVEIANEKMLTLWGKQAADVMNKPIFEGLPEAKDQGLEPLLENVFTTGEKFVANERPVQLPRNGKLETTYVNFVYDALKEADGTISGIVAIAIEVTPQVAARSRVEESEHKVRALVENAPFPIAVYVGREMIVELANQSIIDIWGKGNDVIGRSFKQVLPELDNQLVFEQIERVLTTGESYHTKNTPLDLIVGGKLRTYYFNYSFTPLYDINGNIYGVMNTGVDLTELNIAKKRIEESDKRFRDTMKQAPVGMAILRGPQYIVEMANEAYLQLVDRKEAEFVGRPLFASLPEVEEVVHSLLDSVLNTGVPYHGNEVAIPVNRHGKQDVFYFDFLYYPLREEDGKISGVIVTVTEVSEKVFARKKVEDSEKRYNLMLMQSPFAFLILKGKDMIVHLANESMKEVLGKGTDIEWKPLLEVIPEIKGQAFPDLLANVYKTGIPFSANEMLAQLTRNGKLEDVYFNYVYQPYYEADNTISGVTVIAYDVTSSVIANKKIEASEQRLNIVVEASELGTWELNLKTDEVTYSKRYLEIVGGYKDEVKLDHSQLLQHLHPDDIPIREKAFKEALRTGYLQYEARLIWNDRSIHWMEGRGKVFYDAENKPLKAIGTLRDITEEKDHEQDLKEREEKFRLLADSMPQQIWTSDPEGNLTYYNRSVFDYSGLTLEQINKDGWLQIVHPDDREQNIKEWLGAVSMGEDFLFEHRFRRHDGEYRWQLSRAVPQKDPNGKIQMWVGTSTDIQAQKTFTKELELLVAERTKELEASNAELQKTNKELQSFAYISSHDLQEPLRKIQTFASRITEKEETNLSEQGKDMFNRIQGSAKRMQTLIQDLLAYSRTSTEERQFENTDLNKIIEEVKEDLEEEIKQKHAIVEATQLCEVNIIPFQFRQLMLNLIGNSLKFSKPNDVPVIKITSEIAQGNKLNNEHLSSHKKYCHIIVADNGIGFEERYKEKIFEVFQRLHGKNEYDGTGIGLSIVKKIVENHQGIITATGELNKGATFDIYIPVM